MHTTRTRKVQPHQRVTPAQYRPLSPPERSARARAYHRMACLLSEAAELESRDVKNYIEMAVGDLYSAAALLQREVR